MGGKNKRPWQWTLLGKKGEETSLTSDFGYTHQSYLNAYHQWLILTTIQAASTLDILLRSPNNIASCLYVHRSFWSLWSMGDKQRQQQRMTYDSNSSSLELPPGFWFHPSDEEIITFYLRPKVFEERFTTYAIGEVNINRCEPWELSGKHSYMFMH
jgi:hypothetical protein